MQIYRYPGHSGRREASLAAARMTASPSHSYLNHYPFAVFCLSNVFFKIFLFIFLMVSRVLHNFKYTIFAPQPCFLCRASYLFHKSQRVKKSTKSNKRKKVIRNRNQQSCRIKNAHFLLVIYLVARNQEKAKVSGFLKLIIPYE